MTDEVQSSQSFKESLKATTLFGGIQILNIVIGVVRSKVIAVLLGPRGMGVSGLYTSTTGLISSLTNFGIGVSAVKDISEADNAGDKRRIGLVIGVFKRLVWVTGLLGFVICLVFSPLLSQITFGNRNYTVGFIALSLMLLLQQLTTGQTTLLQGLRKYSFMARAEVTGNLLGLVVTLPLYYIWRINAIVPALLSASIISFVLSLYYARKTKVKKVCISKKDVRILGTGMVRMGFMISLSGLLGMGASYLVRIFISNTGGVNDVGLYTAGFAIVNTYVGLVFTAMSTDYFPRLSAVSSKKDTFNMTMNNQIEIALLIMGPIISLFIIYARLVIRLLYSSKFIPVEGMIYWAIFAIFFKAVSWAIAFSFLAKGDSKAFFFNEFFANIYTTMLNIGCYYLWGLTGMGISFLLGYGIYLVQVWIVCRHRYGICIKKSVYKIFNVQFLISCICLLLIFQESNLLKYMMGTIMIILSFYYSYRELDKRMGIVSLIKNKIRHNE